MHITRRKTRQIQVGTVKVGGDAPVSVQSMCSTDTRDVATTVEQIRQLETAGCELIRVAVPDEDAAAALPKIKAAMTVPLIADIHFDHRLALKAAEVVDCVRINPGNIGTSERVREVIKAAKDNNCSMRCMKGVSEKLSLSLHRRNVTSVLYVGIGCSHDEIRTIRGALRVGLDVF